MKQFPIALQVYSVRDAAAADFTAAMQEVKAMGYDGVELAGTYDLTVAEIKKILDQVGLQLISAHVNIELLEQDEVLDAYAATGMKYIAIPWLDPNTLNKKEQVAGRIAQFLPIGQRCKERGLQLLYHNHDFEFLPIDGKTILDTFYDSIPAELLETEIDTCWANIGGVDPAEYLRKYTGRAHVLHLKDFAGEKTENMYALIGQPLSAEERSAFQFRPVGYGCQNIPSILAAAEEAGVEWLVVEQDRPCAGTTPMECAKMSVDYLKNLMKL